MQHSMEKHVGVIGLGLLGTAICDRLQGQGFRTLGFDIDPSRCRHHSDQGRPLAKGIAHLATSCSKILLSLPDASISLNVIAELTSSLQPGTIVIDTTTGGPEQMQECARQLQAHAARYLDATVGGSSVQVRSGEAIVMVGGEPATVAACHDVFDGLAARTFHLGPAGSGARMKLVLNLVLGLNRAVLAEALEFARAQGLDQNTALEVLQAGPAASQVMRTKGKKMIQRDFAPQARLSQHLKDVRLILAEGRCCGARLILTENHERLLSSLEDDGHGHLDNSAVIEAFRRTDP